MSKKSVIAGFTAALVALGVIAGLTATGRAADRSNRQYEVTVEPQKSDTVRMIEAYERLSDQYLILVQQHLVQMAAADRDILDKLNAINKKLDDLSARLARLEPSANPTDPQPNN